VTGRFAKSFGYAFVSVVGLLAIAIALIGIGALVTLPILLLGWWGMPITVFFGMVFVAACAALDDVL